MILCDHFALFGTWISCCIKFSSVYFHPTNTKNIIIIVQALGLPTYLLNIPTFSPKRIRSPGSPKVLLLRGLEEIQEGLQQNPSRFKMRSLVWNHRSVTMVTPIKSDQSDAAHNMKYRPMCILSIIPIEPLMFVLENKNKTCCHSKGLKGFILLCSSWCWGETAQPTQVNSPYLQIAPRYQSFVYLWGWFCDCRSRSLTERIILAWSPVNENSKVLAMAGGGVTKHMYI